MSTTARSIAPYQVFARGSNFYVRFSIKGQGQIVRSLGTKDEREAHRKAPMVYGEAIHRDSIGLSAKKKKFGQYCDEFLEHLQKRCDNGRIKETQRKRHHAVIDRYLREYFQDENIATITSGKIDHFWHWRDTYWTEGPGASIKQLSYERQGRVVHMPISPRSRKPPSASSKANESQAIRAFFDWARKHGSTKEVVEVEAVKVDPNARPSLSAEEYGQLVALAAARMQEPDIHPRVRQDRARLYAYIELMAYTGMRPTEAKHLKWEHIKGYRYDPNSPPKFDHEIVFKVYGKSKSRPLEAMPEVKSALDMLWIIECNVLGRDPLPSESIFINSRGNIQTTFRSGLSELLRQTGLATDYRGMKRTAYSFRHFYATQMLLANVSINDVAMNMGTGVKMIEQFYSDVRLSMIKDRLRPEWKNVTRRD
ncbi:site-specific integrase [Gluconobacter sp. LMG 1744]|uniref:site-specific integrase n=1 Tax=Gluconobacter cadivus TaxID=2728101 RepID=UPI001884D166|nr:site-specific integrase [Gluconobacter cadivus]MBF0892700.1 site-specific integrase [Gluconobacter cadivus]